MAQLTTVTSAFNGDTTTVDTTAAYPVGQRAFDKAGNEYIYLLGVASTTINSVVTYSGTTYATALIAANAVGDVAVAMASTVASTYGWYMIKGITTAKSDTIASGVSCYIDGTAGRVDDAVVAGDLIVGMYSRSADSSNLCTVQLNYPKVTDVLG